MSEAVPSLRVALKRAQALGCEVHPQRRTGEVLVVAPCGTRIRSNARKKDANRALILLIRKLEDGR